MKMTKLIVATALTILIGSAGLAQDGPLTGPLLEDEETFLLTVYLKHDQTMNISEINELAARNRLNEIFPPEGVEIVDHYVFMGIGQVIVLRVPPNRLRMVNIALEQGAWGAYQTEFYVTYDLAAARIYQQESGQ
ncbi:MAG: hypothetical protein OEQ25_15830 [Gammaproteobacteria bacterium]|nr:hypothetical protein [Gammaproteobacteria bacterium]